MMFQSLASIGTGIIIGFVYCWQLALFIIGFMPFILIAGMLQMKIAKGFSGKNNAALEEAGKVCKYLIILLISYIYVEPQSVAPGILLGLAIVICN